MKLWGSVRSGAAKVAFEADKMVRVRKQEQAIADVQKQIQDAHEALGQTVLALFHAGELQHPQVASVDQQVAALMLQVKQLQEELERIKAEEYVPETPVPEAGAAGPSVAQPYEPPTQPIAPVQPVTPVQPIAPIEPMAPVQPITPIEPMAPVQPVGEGRVCPNCGTSVGPTVAFCPECGTSLKPAQ
ncbi:MAG: zinc-ribbon domain-containing protein [Anaerolineales bacterium]